MTINYHTAGNPRKPAVSIIHCIIILDPDLSFSLFFFLKKKNGFFLFYYYYYFPGGINVIAHKRVHPSLFYFFLLPLLPIVLHPSFSFILNRLQIFSDLLVRSLIFWSHCPPSISLSHLPPLPILYPLYNPSLLPPHWIDHRPTLPVTSTSFIVLGSPIEFRPLRETFDCKKSKLDRTRSRGLRGPLCQSPCHPFPGPTYLNFSILLGQAPRGVIRLWAPDCLREDIMFMHPFGRKVPFLNQDPVCIQDDQIFPEASLECSSQYVEPQPQQLESPFQYHPDLQFVSPPSSAPSSPDSSPTSSFSYLPNTTAVAGDYTPAVFDGHCFEAPSMTPAPSYDLSFQIPSSVSPSQSYLAQYQQQYLFDNNNNNNNPMLTQQPVPNNPGWDGNMQLLSPARMPQQPNNNQNHPVARTPQPSRSSQGSHSRATSSTRSAPAGSSYQRSKPLPTPAQTPVQNSFLAPQFQNYDPASFDMSPPNHPELAMRPAAINPQQQKPQQQVHHQHQSSDHSLAPSVSSVSHNSPVTPQAKLEELDDSSKALVNDYANANSGSMSVGVPKLNRTISDIYQDELYNPTVMVSPEVSKQLAGQQNLLTPQYRSVFADRLQAANQDHLTSRSQSPVASVKRENSPFRQNSPYSAEFNASGLPRSQMATSVPVPATGMAVAQGVAEPKTMSPKDALLDFHEPDDAGLPLFPPATQSDFTPSTQADFNPSTQPDFNLGDALGLRRESSGSFQPSQSFTSMESFPTQYATQPATPQYSFVPQQQQPQQSAPQPPPSAQLQSHPPSTQPQAQNVLQQTPDFPASLPTFETTQFETAGSDVLPSTETPEQMVMIHEDIPRPANTSADSGTYTCTYHGCTMRFPTPAKLQKHKREAHRQTTPGGHLVGRDSASRNSQAGPHKCERINPSTGKPCNSIFSRPYDLTRHEDTIHNARKQKVRCHLCTEEKTFSRNDALTRHMRVVHPEVDWPGKQRRRGRE